MNHDTVDHCCIESDEYWQNKFGLCVCIWRFYVGLFDLCRKCSLIDSPPAILIIQSKETLEIMLQTIAFYFYGGSQSTFIKFVNSGNVDTNSTVILAEKIEYVSLFAYVLSVDCIIIGILWCLYIFQHEIFRASFFRYLLFSIDFVFDMFYATFPLFLIGQSNLAFITAAAKVNSQSMVIFIATLFPIIYVTLKLFVILNVLSNHAATQFNISFRLKGTVIATQASKTTNTAKTEGKIKVITHRPVLDQSAITASQTCTEDLTSVATASTTRNPSPDHIDTQKDQQKHQGNSKEQIAAVGKLTLCKICCHGRKYILSKKQMPQFDQNPRLVIIQYFRRICTVLFGTLVILYGTILLIEIRIHTIDSISICDNYSLNDIDLNSSIDIDSKYAHLYAWENCEYKVHPISDAIPCQCRNLRIYSQTTRAWYQHLQNSTKMTLIVRSILKEYYMLETFLFDGNETQYTNTFDFKDELMSSKKLRILQMEKVSLNTISSKFGLNWANLEFIKFKVTPVNNYMDSNSWSNMKKLKWVELPSASMKFLNLDWICNLKHVRNLALVGTSGNTSLPTCLSKIETIQRLRVEFFQTIDISTLLHPELVFLDAFGCLITPLDFENQLQQIINDSSITIMQLLEAIKDKFIYLQSTPVCDEFYQLGETVFNEKYPLTNAVVNITEGCWHPCKYESLSTLICRPFWYHDGVCHFECNVPDCNYDGGDCNQLCNFTQCDYLSLGDGVCDSECRNEDCGFDYCDCTASDIDAEYTSIEEQSQCYFNYTLCDIETDCVVYDTNSSQSWLGDNICDDYCNNVYCNYDFGECESCENSICSYFWETFEAIANSIVVDNKVSVDEVCPWFEVFKTFYVEDEIYHLNCTQFIMSNDKNNDSMMNGYEAAIALFPYFHFDDYFDDYKAYQVNCSVCWPSVFSYYQ